MVQVPFEELHTSVVVSKKVSTKAVVRNKIRRRIYDIVRQHRTQTGIRGVFIFLVKAPAIDSSYETVRKEVVSCIGKAYPQ